MDTAMKRASVKKKMVDLDGALTIYVGHLVISLKSRFKPLY